MKVYLIECRTGCSCCADENHYRGPFLSKDDAQKRIDYFLKDGVSNNPLASQYAKKGVYYIKEEEAEEISGDRLIIADRVFPKDFRFINEDGTSQYEQDDYFVKDLY